MRRSLVLGYHYYASVNRFCLPGNPRVTKEEIDNMKFDTKTRQQWDYNGINERLTTASEFGNMESRPDFGGPRPDNSPLFAATTSNDFPHFKKLWQHFDKYTQPGSDPKVEAAKAVCEQWDSDHYYYPGETWQRNRPSFRSVPAEVLNKQTWYHWADYYTKWHEIVTTTRSRQYSSPIWPPPGYTKPKLETRRKFVFGVEEPGLVTEIERWGWARMWHENNNRHGPYEIIGWIGLFAIMYIWMKELESCMKFKTMHANQYYPGRQAVRSFGEPADWEKDVWWWQRPLEQFPNQGEIWYRNLINYKYINHLKKLEEEERVAAELAEAGVMVSSQLYQGK